MAVVAVTRDTTTKARMCLHNLLPRGVIVSAISGSLTPPPHHTTHTHTKTHSTDTHIETRMPAPPHASRTNACLLSSIVHSTSTQQLERQEALRSVLHVV